MRHVLVLGGTRFFGKRLVQKLIDNGDNVTVATRGETEVKFDGTVTRVKVNRFDRESMTSVFPDKKWDIIYDQICFSPDDAQDACDVFAGKVNRYVLTSTLSVYQFNEKAAKEEKDFNPFAYDIQSGRKEDFDYSEGKRLAEAVFFQKANFPVVAPRPPIVFGLDDYTERLQYHIRKILRGDKIGIDNVEAKISFVDSEDLAQFLFWIGHQDFVGPVNASAPDQITLGDMIALIERKTGGRAIVKASLSKEESSPMNFPTSYYQDVAFAKAEGYTFKPLSEWFEPLIEALVKNEKST
ncbi:NAD-dependent epimerase/dehydratase family protein [Evansella cellulosilytica]|uniref:NAD-dependent epimerase/dehydratase n=1 Tax=Evansella cellulosilytica (strain ATCC 21833 / DSM 2522 / FERM P-1141 / JCM 9156 / N-4) TaxID=649639 RepID=E6TUD0_EVAC2|nr:NAD-dependent epimerase/dehydratase family protein [Evansella cellulosilytica]ADU29686.1 NAD-dependent epimerase/dehydratase [Evansella cellulosilytica DSM 2522]